MTAAMNNARKTLPLVFILSIIAIFLLFSLVRFFQDKPNRDQYNAAIALMEAGEYKAALDKFSKLSGYKYASSYYFYCYAHWDVERHGGDYAEGHFGLSEFNIHSKGMSPLPADYAEFKEKVDTAYREYQIKQEEERQKREEERRRQEEEAYARKLQGLPFVGLRESDIAKTSLGRPSPNIDYETKSENGTLKLVTFYRWESRLNVVIFSARCIDGKVTHVWDHRDSPWYRSYPDTKASTKATPKPHAPDDYLDSWSYDSFEDFFDDCEEFFEDEEDAEDYYYEYNDW